MARITSDCCAIRHPRKYGLTPDTMARITSDCIHGPNHLGLWRYAAPCAPSGPDCLGGLCATGEPDPTAAKKAGDNSPLARVLSFCCNLCCFLLQPLVGVSIAMGRKRQLVTLAVDESSASFCCRSLSIATDTPATGGGGCSRMAVSSGAMPDAAARALPSATS